MAVLVLQRRAVLVLQRRKEVSRFGSPRGRMSFTLKLVSVRFGLWRVLSLRVKGEMT